MVEGRVSDSAVEARLKVVGGWRSAKNGGCNKCVEGE